MSEWKPKLRADLRWEALDLTAEEGFLLSRVDGATSLEGLRQVTGLSPARLDAMLAKLTRSGALEPRPRTVGAQNNSSPPGDEQKNSSPPGDEQKNSLRAPARAGATTDARRQEVSEIDDDDEALIRVALADLSLDPSLEGDATDEGDPVVDDAYVPPEAAERPLAALAPPPLGDPPDDEVGDTAAQGDASPDAEQAVDDDGAGGTDDAAGEAGEEAADDEAGEEEGEQDGEEEIVEEGNYRKLFETTLHDLPQEEREKLARTESGATLMALCFDPVSAVIAGLMENSDVGFPHARLIARYHRTPQGLEGLFKRAELARDTQTQRWLLANPMLSEPQFKRVLQPKPLAQIYKWSLSRDLPERNRGKVRLLLRSKWSVADGEERASLVWSTEGRCLQFLIGLQLDSKATTLLCARTINSVMLIQSLARFTATPPLLLQHLARQPLVKRQPNLRTLITQHPNCPADLKRKKL